MPALAAKVAPYLAAVLFVFHWTPVTAEDHEHSGHEAASASADQRARDRWMWQLPEQVMAAIDVRPGLVVADVGAGTGYFTFRLAERVGAEGLVYANEIDGEALDEIRARCAAGEVTNVRTVLGAADDANLPDSLFDRILLVNVIHLVDEPVIFLDNLRRDLKPDGTLALVQWDAHKLAKEMPGADPDVELKQYVTQDRISQLDAAGFEVVAIEDFLPLQNIIICRRRTGVH